MSFTIALAQIDPVLGNLEQNVAKHVDASTRALKEGADLVVFPELSLTGYSIKDLNTELGIDVTNPRTQLSPLIELSKSVTILAGGVEEERAFRLHNAAFLFEQGSVYCVHRKIYPPTYGMFEELRYFSAGRSVRAYRSRLGILGILICEDLWHITLPYLLAQDGAQVIIALVASPTRLSGDRNNLDIAAANSENHRAYARLLSSYVIFCNRVGFEDGVNFWGGSSVIAPDGSIVASAKYFEEDLILAKIDEREVRRARQLSRHFLDEDPHVALQELKRILANRK
jgi:predicted amidohydrolase